MKFDNQLMQNALIRINELQQEVIEKSKSISGAEDFVKQKLALYEEDEKIRAMAKNINIQEKRITDNFFNK
ncbi:MULTISPECIES: hypothetical protein [Aliarcobacter]|uniref:Uncharacterized protein n=1 Tax=Aliarcobacter cibarius TaxID=255507 RepID=A0A5J6RL60_9BACT|nr:MULTISPECIES: hypothetical protein [Aliarcobacter]QEZ90077.1 hypothetical protein ACIB15232_1994 [Aliarcobacter cibarius]QKJ28082.1 hypothetical protein ACBT_2200 [Aliarcobacter cibarius]TLT00444.1 hypothetical protein FE247_04030 [Aliarcobacter cibarius]TLT00808.1 hypothetical protein FE245_04485 [Aliarcobacter cibarius]